MEIFTVSVCNLRYEEFKLPYFRRVPYDIRQCASKVKGDNLTRDEFF